MILHSGSVKDILDAGPQVQNELIFKFSDRYSVFDWGRMPDLIPGKGQALATMGKLFFEELASVGVKTHYLGQGEAPNEFRVKKITVPRGNIALYRDQPEWTLIPLEVIYRFGVPKGSSLLKRSDQYHEGQEFSEPLLDYTTKLERMDRVLTRDEAQALACMNDVEWATLESTTIQIGKQVRARFEKLGLKLWDGKLEFAFGTFREHARDIVLVDSIGLDEMRLTLEGKTLSKEILRQFYVHTDWYMALLKAKAEDPVHFKENCIQKYQLEPKPLDTRVIHAVGELYTAVADLMEVNNPKSIERIRQAFQILESST